MDIKLILNDTTEITLPPTLMVNGLMNEADYELHRAPFSSIQVVAGDGIAKAGPLTIAGKAYFPTTGDAEAWMKNLNEKITDVVAVHVGSLEIPVHAVDFVALPVLLPRTLQVKMRFFPKEAR